MCGIKKEQSKVVTLSMSDDILNLGDGDFCIPPRLPIVTYTTIIPSNMCSSMLIP